MDILERENSLTGSVWGVDLSLRTGSALTTGPPQPNRACRDCRGGSRAEAAYQNSLGTKQDVEADAMFGSTGFRARAGNIWPAGQI